MRLVVQENDVFDFVEKDCNKVSFSEWQVFEEMEMTMKRLLWNINFRVAKKAQTSPIKL